MLRLTGAATQVPGLDHAGLSRRDAVAGEDGVTLLVEVLSDRRVKLILSAAVPAEAWYTEGPLAHEFPRTVSRLREMASREFLALAKRNVDTSLT